MATTPIAAGILVRSLVVTLRRGDSCSTRISIPADVRYESSDPYAIDFTKRTYALVPSGYESGHLDFAAIRAAETG